MQGTSYFEPFSSAAVQEIQIPQNSPSHRVSGDTSQLIETLKNKLIAIPIRLNESVSNLNFENDKALITTQSQFFAADYVISTLPLALFANDLIITPALPQKLTNFAKNLYLDAGFH
jgi:protoporphyrinogen oxidase